MTEPRRPYYVSFVHDSIPTRQQIDHSRSQPGPAGGSANRAGFTSVTSRARLTIAWDRGPAVPSGRFPMFAQSVNVYFRLTDFLVAISSDYAAGSCAFTTTLQHELETHIYDPIRIFRSFRDVVIQRLNGITVPIREAPLFVMSEAEASRQQDELARRIASVIGQTRRELLTQLEDARNAHDSGASYRLVHNQCSDVEWATGR